jgi:hypothetical protein
VLIQALRCESTTCWDESGAEMCSAAVAAVFGCLTRPRAWPACLTLESHLMTENRVAESRPVEISSSSSTLRGPTICMQSKQYSGAVVAN